jgi:hypothetical protein
MMTEEEAREKWCPFARTQVLQTDDDGTVYGAAVNRTILPAPQGIMSELVAGTQCIGSRCMAWQWVGMFDGKRHGYCGAFQR